MNKLNNTERNKSPWPTKDAMEQIYSQKLWGGSVFDFYSGEGSHNSELVLPYLDVVISFLNSFENPITVCDLGCGDFNIGKEFVSHSKKYHAVDIAENLIERNREKFKADNLTFHCLNIATDDLPSGDCVIIRQVLQHLSNAEVKQVVDKLSNYNYVILTEHLPLGDFEANKDIISGQGIRLKKQSGINLLEAPFNIQVKSTKQLLSIELKEGKGVIDTTLFTVF